MPRLAPLRCLCLVVASAAASPESVRANDPGDEHPFERTGRIEARDLDEASGLEASRAHPGHWFALNDSDRGATLFVLADDGAHLARIALEQARNVDWEALASMPSAADPERRLLAVGDIGDNAGRREAITVYLVDEPRPDSGGHYPQRIALMRAVTLRYPDGPRDAEAMAWDPVSDRLVVVSKRDRPARVYAVDRAALLAGEAATLAFVGTLYALRPPDAADARRFGAQAPWVSQPTGMDIRADGSEIAVITYRSLYRFARAPGQALHAALAAAPVEAEGPPGATEEAVAYEPGGGAVRIASEGSGAALYRGAEAPQAAARPGAEDGNR